MHIYNTLIKDIDGIRKPIAEKWRKYGILIETDINNDDNIIGYEQDIHDVVSDYNFIIWFKNEQSIYELKYYLEKNYPITVKLLYDQIEDKIKNNEDLVIDFYINIKIGD